MGLATLAQVVRPVRVGRKMSGAPDDWPALTRLAARIEPILSSNLELAWREGMALADDRALRVAAARYDEEGLFQALRLTGADERMVQAMRPLLTAGFIQGADYAADVLVARGFSVTRDNRATISFEAINPKSVEWAKKHAARNVVALAEVRAAIRRLVAASQMGLYDVHQLARRVREVIGLDRRRLDALNSFAVRLARQGVTAGDLDRRVRRYAEALHRDRAQTIARTESISALNAGQQALWDEGVKAGVLNQKLMQKTWITTQDELLCPVCESMDGEAVDLDDMFSAGVEHPPAHPRCRCSTGLVQKEGR